MTERVEAALARIRPGLQADGGDVRLLGVEDGVVRLQLTGACAGCAMSTITLRNVVERLLRLEVPEIKDVVAG